MEKKINVAELLKNCPKGMELDCATYENVVFDYVDDTNDTFSIKCHIKLPDNKCSICTFTIYGGISLHTHAKCVIYPKGKTTWEGFVPPCKFNNGDIIYVKDKYNQEWCSILSNYTDNKLYTYIDFCINSNILYHNKPNILCEHKDILEYRYATREEQQKLFDSIKERNYIWDTKTKTLKKLTKSHKEEIKNKVVFDSNAQCCDITNNLIKEENKTLEEVIKPKFPTGEWVVFNNQSDKGSIYQIKNIHNYEYTLQHILGGSMSIPFSNENMLRLWTIDDAKDGDILCYKDEISIHKHVIKNCTKQEETFGGFVYHCCYDSKRFITDSLYSLTEQDKMDIHPATKEQRDLLFTKMKEANYKWDKETKTFKEIIKPKFKVGDRIIHKIHSTHPFVITEITEQSYKGGTQYEILIEQQDNFVLVPNKFDINTLIPFESKVLVRDNDVERWRPTFWGFYDNDDELNYPYECVGDAFAQCIPYEGNEYLIGTNNKCDNFYKTWK